VNLPEQRFARAQVVAESTFDTVLGRRENAGRRQEQETPAIHPRLRPLESLCEMSIRHSQIIIADSKAVGQVRTRTVRVVDEPCASEQVSMRPSVVTGPLRAVKKISKIGEPPAADRV
jgi:hypothetical protein